MSSSASSSFSSLPVFENVQLGAIKRPAQLVRNGFPSDYGKKCTSAQILLRDPESIQALQAIETELEQKAPAGFVLNSSCIRTVEDGDVTYPVVRCKLTRDHSAFTSINPGPDDAASSLDELGYGHEVVGLFRPLAWKRDGKVGVTLYCNRLRCSGKAIAPIGEYVREEVDWK